MSRSTQQAGFEFSVSCSHLVMGHRGAYVFMYMYIMYMYMYV